MPLAVSYTVTFTRNIAFWLFVEQHRFETRFHPKIHAANIDRCAFPFGSRNRRFGCHGHGHTFFFPHDEKFAPSSRTERCHILWSWLPVTHKTKYFYTMFYLNWMDQLVRAFRHGNAKATSTIFILFRFVSRCKYLQCAFSLIDAIVLGCPIEKTARESRKKIFKWATPIDLTVFSKFSHFPLLLFVCKQTKHCHFFFIHHFYWVNRNNVLIFRSGFSVMDDVVGVKKIVRPHRGTFSKGEILTTDT